MSKPTENPLILEQLKQLREQLSALAQDHDRTRQELMGLAQASHSIAQSLQAFSAHYNNTLPLLFSIRESANLSVRHSPKAKTIRCLFLVHTIAMWEGMVEVYEHMLADARFDPIIVTLDHRKHGLGDFHGEASVSHSFDAQGLPHLRLNVSHYHEGLSILKSLSPDIIFRQQPWDGDVEPGYSSLELGFAHLCLLPYCPASTRDTNTADDKPKEFFGFDQAYHRSAWRVFCESEAAIEAYRSFRHADPAKFILAGYLKAERLLRMTGQGHWPIAEPDGRRFRVIWAPHHSVYPGSFGFGVFHTIYIDMLKWAASTSDIQFVLKPHPALGSGIEIAGQLSRDQYQRYLEAWSSLDNCSICEGQYIDLFAASDLLISDGVSFLLEYPILDKPLIFFDSGSHLPFNELGETAVACATTVHTFEALQRATLAYKNHELPILQPERDRLRKALLPCNQSPADIILDSIADGLNARSA